MPRPTHRTHPGQAQALRGEICSCSLASKPRASEGKCPSCSQVGPGLLSPTARRRRPSSPRCQAQVGSDAGLEPKGRGMGATTQEEQTGAPGTWEGSSHPQNLPGQHLGLQRSWEAQSQPGGGLCRGTPSSPRAVWKEAQGLWGAEGSALTPTPGTMPSLPRWALWPGSGHGRPWSSWDASGLRQSWPPPSRCTCRASCCPMARRGLAL